MSNAKYVGSTEAAEIAGCEAQHITRLCRAEKIPGAIQLGREWAIPRKEVEKLRKAYEPGGVGRPRKRISEKT